MQHLRFAYAVNDFKYVVGVRGDVQHRTAHISTRAHLTHRTKPRWESRRSHHITPGSSRGGHKMNYWRLRINSPTRIPAMTQTRDAGSSRPDPHAGHQASVTHSSTASKSGGFSVVMRHIDDEILAGRWVNGSRLPPERELAASLSVSRGAVREAIRALEAQGILSSGTGRSNGTRVDARPSDAMGRILRLQLALDVVSFADLTEPV